MNCYLGLDTSNYTTSVAAFDAEAGVLWQVKQLLPVADGKLGLRQSDAVFHHVRQLPELFEKLYCQIGIVPSLEAVGASDRPQQTENSYMPCFLVGEGAARQQAASLGKPLYRFTHQQGHVMAALYGSGSLAWRHEPFLAFHVSGGTTDALLVQPSDKTVLSCEKVACSRDLKAGQLIDRVGGMLGLPFPAGPALECLAKEAIGTVVLPRASMDGASCHLSGVENKCRALLEKGTPAAEIALFCLRSIQSALERMTEALLLEYGDLPLIYAGGVMSNTLLKEALTARFGGRFAPPEYSADNAAGIAVLTALQHRRMMA